MVQFGIEPGASSGPAAERQYVRCDVRDDVWPTLSNAFAISAMLPTQMLLFAVMGFTSDPPLYLGCLAAALMFAGYLAARRINGCAVPFRRVLLVWSIFSAGFIGLVTPLVMIIKGAPLARVLAFPLLSIPFALVGMWVWRSVRRVEENHT
jgi:hypothetical protein